jgi:hypothetical protein
MIYSVGIDNGLKGAVVLLDENVKVVKWWDTPVMTGHKPGRTPKGKKRVKTDLATTEMGNIIRWIIDHIPTENAALMFWIEKAWPMQGQGLSSTFKTAQGYGIWEGVCIGARVQYDIVSPRTWQKAVLQDMPAGDPKTRSMGKCQRIFPSIPLKTPTGRKLSFDGRADAAMIAYYGLLQMKGKKEEPRVRKNPPPRRQSKIQRETKY